MASGKGVAKQLPQGAILEIRRDNNWSIRSWARYYGVTVPDIHQAANCVEQRDCKGRGCRIR